MQRKPLKLDFFFHLDWIECDVVDPVSKRNKRRRTFVSLCIEWLKGCYVERVLCESRKYRLCFVFALLMGWHNSIVFHGRIDCDARYLCLGIECACNLIWICGKEACTNTTHKFNFSKTNEYFGNQRMYDTFFWSRASRRDRKKNATQESDDISF